MIKVTNVTKRFGNLKALDGLDMNVGRGQIYGLVGPNGAGKMIEFGVIGSEKELLLITEIE